MWTSVGDFSNGISWLVLLSAINISIKLCAGNNPVLQPFGQFHTAPTTQRYSAIPADDPRQDPVPSAVKSKTMHHIKSRSSSFFGTAENKPIPHTNTHNPILLKIKRIHMWKKCILIPGITVKKFKNSLSKKNRRVRKKISCWRHTSFKKRNSKKKRAVTTKVIKHNILMHKFLDIYTASNIKWTRGFIFLIQSGKNGFFGNDEGRFLCFKVFHKHVFFNISKTPKCYIFGMFGNKNCCCNQNGNWSMCMNEFIVGLEQIISKS